MKQKKIRYFSPQEIQGRKTKEAPKENVLKCSVSKTGRLSIPQNVQEELGMDSSSTKFKVGTEDRKRQFKTLFLIPAGQDDQDAFDLAKTGRGQTISLAGVFDKVGLDYATQQHEFTIKPFSQEGVSGYALQLVDESSPRQKPEGGGRRGRKKASQTEGSQA
ncbi:hypothetical protein GCM10023189_35960 [Nibrella saemangeumensis]|uniref:SpoVT-AbrB domain-containing protein n=1 Tax=Nibrella saemangeumensis TaxID=1084526 RepID=A0ABP8N637_9BACT